MLSCPLFASSKVYERISNIVCKRSYKLIWKNISKAVMKELDEMSNLCIYMFEFPDLSSTNINSQNQNSTVPNLRVEDKYDTMSSIKMTLLD
jgi:hypothetical protein